MRKKSLGFLAAILLLSFILPLAVFSEDYNRGDISYDELMRYPEKYKGKEVSFAGEVATAETLEGGQQVLLLELYDKENNIVIVNYKPDSSIAGRILEKDEIRVIGIFDELGKYDEIPNKGKKKERTAPSVTGKIIVLEKNTLKDNQTNAETYVWETDTTIPFGGIFKNKSKKNAYILCGISFSDEDENILDYQVVKIGPIAPGQEAISIWDTYSNWYYGYCSYVGISAEDGEKGIQKDLKYKTSEKDNMLTIEITNKGKETLRNVTYTAVFFKDGSILYTREGALNSMKDVKKGEVLIEKLSANSLMYDKVKIYFEGEYKD